MIEKDDLPHIETAIDAAQDSRLEDSKKPKVGAVLVNDGKEIERAFRGETGVGDHAEYALLAKKLKGRKVSGATIYTTLEPCTARGDRKVPCADRIAERRIKRVVIGMLDPNQDICGRGIRLLRSAGIEVDLFPVKQMSEVEEQNHEFTREQERLSKARSRDGKNRVNAGEGTIGIFFGSILQV
jgi:pyrimidine deaminase RibD-like protein